MVSESCFTEKIRESELLPPDAMRGQEGVRGPELYSGSILDI